MIKSIAFANNKGGVAKTTTTLNIGACLAMHGYKVLLIDGDPQANLTISFGLSDDMDENIGKLLEGKKTFQEVKKTVDLENGKTLDILPSARQVRDIEIALYSKNAREHLLKKVLEKAQVSKIYDFILIDCAPNLGLITTNALSAVDEFIIPYQAEFFSTQGTQTILEFATITKEDLNPKLEFGGLIITKFNENTRGKSSKEFVQEIKESSIGEKVYNTTIRNNIKLMESPMYCKTIFQYAPESNGAQDYYNLVEEFLIKNNLISVHGTVI